MNRAFKIDEEVKQEKCCCSDAKLELNERLSNFEKSMEKKLDERLSNFEKTMERKMEEIQNIILSTNSKMIALMEQQRRNMLTPKSEFPIILVESLSEINKQIGEAPNNYHPMKLREQ
ncbi:hypothetical protein ACLKA7_007585 [Drosophila subpalustris]